MSDLTRRTYERYAVALEGKTITGVDVGDLHELRHAALRFRCADGSNVIWGTYGDCCSETWWADGYSLNALRGATVRQAEEIELPDYNVQDGRERQEEDVAYGVRIATDRGEARFVFRNSSNGYYGGEAGLWDEDQKIAWTEILGNDWAA